jgi:hypothetical protein
MSADKLCRSFLLYGSKAAGYNPFNPDRHPVTTTLPAPVRQIP